MSADSVHGEAGGEFVIAVVECGALGIDVADHLKDVFEIERRTQHAMTHRAAGGERHLAILKMKARQREAVEIAGVIVMEMGDNDVGDAFGIDADEAQGIDGVAKPFAAAAISCFLGEAGVEDERAVRAARDPDEVVEVGGEFVRVGGDEILGRIAIAEMAVPNREHFKWFDRHAGPFILSSWPA